MSRFKVQMKRDRTESAEVTVDADTWQEARRKALDSHDDVNFGLLPVGFQVPYVNSVPIQVPALPHSQPDPAPCDAERLEKLEEIYRQVIAESPLFEHWPSRALHLAETLLAERKDQP